MNKILLFTGIVILWDSQLIFAVDHNDIIENNISCLYFHLRCEEASKPVVRVGGGRFLSESRPVPALNIVWKFYILLTLGVILQSSPL